MGEDNIIVSELALNQLVIVENSQAILEWYDNFLI